MARPYTSLLACLHTLPLSRSRSRSRSHQPKEERAPPLCGVLAVLRGLLFFFFVPFRFLFCSSLFLPHLARVGSTLASFLPLPSTPVGHCTQMVGPKVLLFHVASAAPVVLHLSTAPCSPHGLAPSKFSPPFHSWRVYKPCARPEPLLIPRLRTYPALFSSTSLRRFDCPTMC